MEKSRRKKPRRNENAVFRGQRRRQARAQRNLELLRVSKLSPVRPPPDLPTLPVGRVPISPVFPNVGGSRRIGRKHRQSLNRSVLPTQNTYLAKNAVDMPMIPPPTNLALIYPPVRTRSAGHSTSPLTASRPAHRTRSPRSAPTRMSQKLTTQGLVRPFNPSRAVMMRAITAARHTTAEDSEHLHRLSNTDLRAEYNRLAPSYKLPNVPVVASHNHTKRQPRNNNEAEAVAWTSVLASSRPSTVRVKKLQKDANLRQAATATSNTNLNKGVGRLPNTPQEPKFPKVPIRINDMPNQTTAIDPIVKENMMNTLHGKLRASGLYSAKEMAKARGVKRSAAKSNTTHMDSVKGPRNRKVDNTRRKSVLPNTPKGVSNAVRIQRDLKWLNSKLPTKDTTALRRNIEAVKTQNTRPSHPTNTITFPKAPGEPPTTQIKDVNHALSLLKKFVMCKSSRCGLLQEREKYEKDVITHVETIADENYRKAFGDDLCGWAKSSKFMFRVYPLMPRAHFFELVIDKNGFSRHSFIHYWLEADAARHTGYRYMIVNVSDHCNGHRTALFHVLDGSNSVFYVNSNGGVYSELDDWLSKRIVRVPIVHLDSEDTQGLQPFCVLHSVLMVYLLYKYFERPQRGKDRRRNVFQDVYMDQYVSRIREDGSALPILYEFLQLIHDVERKAINKANLDPAFRLPTTHDVTRQYVWPSMDIDRVLRQALMERKDLSLPPLFNKNTKQKFPFTALVQQIAFGAQSSNGNNGTDHSLRQDIQRELKKRLKNNNAYRPLHVSGLRYVHPYRAERVFSYCKGSGTRGRPGDVQESPPKTRMQVPQPTKGTGRNSNKNKDKRTVTVKQDKNNKRNNKIQFPAAPTSAPIRTQIPYLAPSKAATRANRVAPLQVMVMHG